MIIQCEKCQTRFRLDDSRVTVKGVKVRCTKCKHVFTVRKEEPDGDFLQPKGALAEFTPPATDSIVFDETPFDNEREQTGFSPFESSTTDASNKSFETEELEAPVTESGDLLSPETPADVPFSLGEIDFSDELSPVAVPQASQDDLKPSQEILSVPLAEVTVEAEGDKIAQSFLEEAVTSEQQALPPLPIASRREQSPLFGALIAVAALLTFSVLGYFGYSYLSISKETAPPESGKISVRAVTSAFVKNAVVGELLVVSGEAFNEYSKPRAALQVMVTVFDATGQGVATKSAYCGNPLTEEQLKNLPLDKIEAAMANPFGDSLVNMGVAPGKSIPFIVVLAKLPAGVKDFSVQSAGSTVATGK